MNPHPNQLPHHFTASGLVLCQGHVLMVHHKRIGAWVPPGGHIEPSELPEQTVARELMEETGVQVAVLSPPVPETGDAEAFFLGQPLYVQSVLAIENKQRFYHIDLAYLCRVLPENSLDERGMPVLNSSEEVKESKWISLKDISSYLLAKNVKEALAVLEDDTTLARFTEVAWHWKQVDKPKR